MWTLTIDPSLFSSPRAAFEHLRKKQSVAVLVRRLKAKGVLHSSRYFYVVEWQKETEMPHVHLLLDASHVPFDLVCEIWNRNRPKDAGPVEGSRPGFGSVRFTAPRFAGAKHAANYACKYVIKQPEHGYPAWVLEMTHVQRYGHSRGLFGPSNRSSEAAVSDVDEKKGSEESSGHDDTCFCEVCRGEVDEQRKPAVTIGERVAKCGQRAVVMKVREVITPGGEIIEERMFAGEVACEYAEVLHQLGIEAEEKPRRVAVSQEQARALLAGEWLGGGNGSDEVGECVAPGDREKWNTWPAAMGKEGGT